MRCTALSWRRHYPESTCHIRAHTLVSALAGPREHREVNTHQLTRPASWAPDSPDCFLLWVLTIPQPNTWLHIVTPTWNARAWGSLTQPYCKLFEGRTTSHIWLISSFVPSMKLNKRLLGARGGHMKFTEMTVLCWNQTAKKLAQVTSYVIFAGFWLAHWKSLSAPQTFYLHL